jgi:hypothetical protein
LAVWTESSVRSATAVGEGFAKNPVMVKSGFTVTSVWALARCPDESETRTVTVHAPMAVGVHERSEVFELAHPVGSPE